MEPITVHIFKNEFVMICCPFCKLKKRVATKTFKDKKHQIGVRCKCGERFQVQFNYRKSYRKSVAITGEYKTLKPTISAAKTMQVCDLSRHGLRIKMIDPAVVHRGDEILVKFILDDNKRTSISTKVGIRFVRDEFLGCEFTELNLYEKALGFYLMS